MTPEEQARIKAVLFDARLTPGEQDICDVLMGRRVE